MKSQPKNSKGYRHLHHLHPLKKMQGGLFHPKNAQNQRQASGQCSIALLVLPLLVDTGVDMRHLRPCCATCKKTAATARHDKENALKAMEKPATHGNSCKPTIIAIPISTLESSGKIRNWEFDGM